MTQDERSDTIEKPVLLAEAHPASRRLTAALLEKLSFRVEAVTNGVEVLKTIESDPQRFGMVFMNCRLPELDGPETAKAIRWLERQWGSRILIVALSADEQDREECIDAGADGALTGPVTLQSLRQVIADLQASQPSLVAGQRQRSEFTADSPVLDTRSIENLRRLTDEGGGDFLTEVIDIFLRDSVRWMDQIRSSASETDAAELRGAVHTLKGSSSSIGASRLAAVCTRFQQRIDRGEWSDLVDWVQQVEEAYEQTRQALIAERQS